MTQHDVDELDTRIEARLAEFEAKLLKAVTRTVFGVLGLLIAGVLAFGFLSQRVNEAERRIGDIEQVGSAPVRVAIGSIQATINANAETLRRVQQDMAEIRRMLR